MWRHLAAYTRNVFLSTVMFCIGVVMAPVLWHLWIYAGSANANFYFAITLVISTAQVLFLTDLLFAFVRRDYDLIHGTDRKKADGKPLPIILDWLRQCVLCLLLLHVACFSVVLKTKDAQLVLPSEQFYYLINNNAFGYSINNGVVSRHTAYCCSVKKDKEV